MKKPFRSVLLSLFSLAVLGVLLWFGDARKVFALIDGFHPIYIAWFILLLLLHELVRGVLWHILVHALCADVPLRAEAFAFAGGEAAKFLPTGVYVQNYLLQRLAGVDFGRSSAATTAMIVGEIVAALVGVVFLGIGLWSPWLLLAVVGGIVAVLLLARPAHTISTPRWARGRRPMERAFDVYRQFRAGTVILARPGIAAAILGLSLVYVGLAGADLYMVVRGLGVDSASFWQVEAVSCFGLAFYVVLGSLEAADLGAFISVGVGKSAAVSAILIYRGLSLGATVTLSVIVMFLLRDQWPALRRHRRSVAAGRPVPAPERVQSQ
jgi:uncharacterized membrane protein YbhN (UPF0104 family)